MPEPRLQDGPVRVGDPVSSGEPAPPIFRAVTAYRPLAEFFHLNASNPLEALAEGGQSPWDDHATQTALARRLDAAGVRLALERTVAEVEPRRYDWSATDQALRMVTDSMLEPTVVLGGAPRQRLDFADPSVRQSFAAWARAAGERTAQAVTWYELWDSPNTPTGWGATPDPQRYALLLGETAPALRRGNPNARLVGMGTLGADLRFIEAAYEAGAATWTDAVSYQHISSEKNEGVMEEEIIALRRLMERYGDGKSPLFITRFGLSTGPSNMVEQDEPDIHASWMVKKHLVALANGVDRVYYYKLMDDHAGRKANGLWGLLEEDATRKPAWRAYRTMAEHLAPARFVGRAWGVTDDPRGVQQEPEVQIFSRPDGSLLAVAWVRRDGANVDIRLPATGPVQVTDLMGVPLRTITPGADGHARVPLTSDPVYISGLAPGALLLAGVRIEPENLYLAPGETQTLTVTFANPLNRPVTIPLDPLLGRRERLGLEITGPGNTLEVPARSTRSATLTVTLDLDARPFPPLVLRHPGRDGGVSWSATIRHNRAFDVSMYAEPLGDNLWVWMDYRNLTADPMPVRVALRGNTDVLTEVSPQRPLEPGIQRSSSIVFPFESGETTIHGSIVSATGPRAESRLRVWVQPLLAERPRIDGMLDEWEHIPPARLRPQQHQAAPPRSERPIEAEELSADVRLWWTAETLYIAADVTDVTPRMNPFESNNLWRGDSLELYLGFRGPTREESFGDRHFQIGISPGSSTSPPFAWNWVPRERDGVAPPAEGLPILDAQVATRTTPQGYVIEAAIPMSEFGIAVSPGMVLGFTMHLNNRDDESTEGRGDTLIWNGTPNNWRNPSLWGVAVLRQSETVSPAGPTEEP